ncbi:hypothetical protein CMO90_04500 [Candidatus Woesearchaeota archaeon]|jgi:hypothetical protein|nr:hypothetical protein [Candidatus Woesearchaeota archaeon]|tara:strand:+ start:791 stop:1924 length:1134 start_codon:yes stop_codon:yes gene_type:complete
MSLEDLPVWGGVGKGKYTIHGLWIGTAELNSEEKQTLEKVIIEIAKETTNIQDESPEKKTKGLFFEKLGRNYYFFKNLKYPSEKEPFYRYGKQILNIKNHKDRIFLQLENKVKNKERIIEEMKTKLEEKGFIYNKKAPDEYLRLKINKREKESENKEKPIIFTEKDSGKKEVEKEKKIILEKKIKMSEKMNKRADEKINIKKPNKTVKAIKYLFETVIFAGIIGGGYFIYDKQEKLYEIFETINIRISSIETTLGTYKTNSENSEKNSLTNSIKTNEEEIMKLEKKINDYNTQTSTTNNLITQNQTTTLENLNILEEKTYQKIDSLQNIINNNLEQYKEQYSNLQEINESQNKELKNINKEIENTKTGLSKKMNKIF